MGRITTTTPEGHRAELSVIALHIYAETETETGVIQPTFIRKLPLDPPPPPPPSSFHHLSFVLAFVFVFVLLLAATPARLTTVDRPEDTPRLPPPGNDSAPFSLPFFLPLGFAVGEAAGMSSLPCSSPSSSPPSADSDTVVERDRLWGTAGGGLAVPCGSGRTFFSHVLRCRRKSAIVARASVT